MLSLSCQTTLFTISLSLELIKAIAICYQTNLNFTFHTEDMNSLFYITSRAAVFQQIEGGDQHYHTLFHQQE